MTKRDFVSRQYSDDGATQERRVLDVHGLRPVREQDLQRLHRLHHVLQWRVRRRAELEVMDAVQGPAELTGEHLAPPAVRRPRPRPTAASARSARLCRPATAATGSETLSGPQHLGEAPAFTSASNIAPTVRRPAAPSAARSAAQAGAARRRSATTSRRPGCRSRRT